MLSCIGSSNTLAADSTRIQVLAPGYTALQFPAPVVGSYQLPVLWAAPDGKVMDSTGRPTRLHDLMGDKPVVMNFIPGGWNRVLAAALVVNCSHAGPSIAKPLRTVREGPHVSPSQTCF